MPPQPWHLLPQIEPSAALRDAVGGHPLVARLLAQREFDTPEKAIPFLDSAAYTPSPPSALVGLEQAGDVLMQAVETGENILVWGDFDVDGQTSTTLLVSAIRELSAPDRVHFHVPNRFHEGHGIQPRKLHEFLNGPTFQPRLLLTCDTGIAEGEGVGLAKDAGLTVVVTDHHDLPAEFARASPGAAPPCGESPDAVGVHAVRRADAIVNPKFLPAGDPLRALPGVGVAYKLVQHLFELAGRPDDATKYLDLVALGIVADVAEQLYDTRYLLQLGLDVLRTTRRIGLKALMESARVSAAKLDAQSIGFQLGPRMNALGRLDDATVAVELLTTDDPARAAQLAAQMERLNNERRLLTSQITQTAFDMLERNPTLLDFNAIVLANSNWHAGIVGIVASRLVEEFHKPVVLLCSPPGEPARGSARSTPGVDIGASIAACARMLIQHGGHPGAAGLSLHAGKVDRFRRELSRQVALHRIDAGPEGLQLDAELPFSSLDLPLVEQVERLAPFGNGNAAPIFISRGLTVRQDRRIGQDGAHRRLSLQDRSGKSRTAIWWRSADQELPEGPVDIAYTLNVNEYRGERSLQLTLAAVRAAQGPDLEAAAQAVDAARSPRITVHDRRGSRTAPSDLPAYEDAFWFAEGTRLGEVPFSSRLEAVAAPKSRPLVLWAAPPSPELLSWLVETLSPSELYLVGRDCAVGHLDALLKQVAGMAKWSMGSGGATQPNTEQKGLLNLNRMAARIGVTETVIRCSLLWLQDKGILRLVQWEGGDAVRVEPGAGHINNGDALSLRRAELEELLAEVRAYRRFFRRAQVRALEIPDSVPYPQSAASKEPLPGNS